jgi:hypothetical protein
MVQWTKRLAAVRWPWVRIPGPAPPKWGHPRWMNSPQEAPPKFVDEQPYGKAVELACETQKKEKKEKKEEGWVAK